MSSRATIFALLCLVVLLASCALHRTPCVPQKLVAMKEGRLANRLVSITNGLAIAQRLGTTFEYPGFDEPIMPFSVAFSRGGGHTNEVLRRCKAAPRQTSLYYAKGLHLSHARRRELLHRFVLPRLLLPDLPVPSPNTLCIHIRSGDIIVKAPKQRRVHPTYVQPPVSFYTHVIRRGCYDRVVVVTEPDRRNPAIGALQRRFGSLVTVQSSSLEVDVATMLSVRHLVVNSCGTFGIMHAMLSTQLQHLHMPLYLDSCGRVVPPPNEVDLFYDFDFSGLPFRTHLYSIRGYTLPGSWDASEAQLKLMVEHSESLVRPLAGVS